MKNSKLNQDFIERYKAVFADRVISLAYSEKEVLTGSDLLNVTPIRQLNLFVLKSLFRSWQEEVKKLESPYFDYKDSTIRKGLIQLMNELSQKISISAEHLKPLIQGAVEETIKYSFEPAQYLSQELTTSKGLVLTNRKIKQFSKYLVFYRDEVISLLESEEDEKNDLVSEKIRSTLDINTTELFDELFDQLSEILVLDRNDLLIPQIDEPLEFDSFDESMDEDDILDDPEPGSSDSQPEGLLLTGEDAPGLNPDVVDNSSGEEESPFQQENEPESQDDEVSHTQMESEESNAVTDEPQDNISEEIGISESQVEEFESSTVDASTLEEIENEKGIDNIMDAISINHRYMFLQELFDGDNEKFSVAVAQVETSESFDEAVEMLMQTYAKSLNWDMNSDEVKEFLKVIFRRFR